VQEYSEDGDFGYGSNIAGYNPEVGASNNFAGYWFGVFYVLFYLSDTVTNVPYEALGPELHNDSEVLTKPSVPTCDEFLVPSTSLSGRYMLCLVHESDLVCCAVQEDLHA
jgi:hypothetical protein